MPVVRRLMNAGAIAQQLTSAPSVPSGTLRFWGDWFGSPYDNVHRIVTCAATGDALAIEFDGGERLVVENPSGAVVTPTEFYISDATKVRWEWFYYGRPRTAESIYFLEYVRSESGVDGSTNVDWYKHDFRTSIDAKAVEIL